MSGADYGDHDVLVLGSEPWNSYSEVELLESLCDILSNTHNLLMDSALSFTVRSLLIGTVLLK